MAKKRCVLCGEEALEKIFCLKNSPRYAQKLLKESELAGSDKKDVLLYRCRGCQMVQIDVNELSQEEYFHDYLMSRSCTELYTEYDNSIAKKFAEKFQLKGKKIVEIGCGDGYFAEKLMKEGVKVDAIEPSKTACDHAQKRGVRCHNVFLDESVDKHVHEKYDGFVSKQVMDLIKDPNTFLRSLGKILKPGARGFIDVPSWTKDLLEHRYYDILADRVSYFTALTLTEIMERNNFHVTEVEHTVNGEYVLAYACYQGQKDGLLVDFNREFEDFEKEFCELINKYASEKKEVVAWGAGGKGVSLLSFSGMDSSKIKYVMDKDPYKQGFYLPGSHIKIVSPDVLNEKKRPAAIIVTGAMFYKEITKEIVNKYKYEGDIVLITPKPHVLSKQEISKIIGVK